MYNQECPICRSTLIDTEEQDELAGNDYYIFFVCPYCGYKTSVGHG